MDDVVQDDSDHVLPPMQEGDRVKLLGGHFRRSTSPSRRRAFTEASLVKALEEYGIGRPSTYASIISTLRDREYVEIESRRFTATDIGKIVSRFLTQYFTTYVDYDFTAKMEDSLDAVATGEQEWVPLLDKFWKPFIKLVNHTESLGQPRRGSAGARPRHRPRERQADERAHGPVRTVRADRHQGRRRQAALRGPAARPKNGSASRTTKRWCCSNCRASSASPEQGEEITSNTGRFGPYVKYGAKYVSLKTDDPYTITQERALEVIRDKEIADANRLILDFPDAGIQVLNGRYGPYITDKTRNAKIPEGQGSEEPHAGRVSEPAGRRSAAKMGPQVRQGLGQGGANSSRGFRNPPAAAPTQPAGEARHAASDEAAKAAPQRLAAKASKAAAKKRAPAQPPAPAQ